MGPGVWASVLDSILRQTDTNWKEMDAFGGCLSSPLPLRTTPSPLPGMSCNSCLGHTSSSQGGQWAPFSQAGSPTWEPITEAKFLVGPGLVDDLTSGLRTAILSHTLSQAAGRREEVSGL
jgi:hypothetical protein